MNLDESIKGRRDVDSTKKWRDLDWFVFLSCLEKFSYLMTQLSMTSSTHYLPDHFLLYLHSLVSTDVISERIHFLVSIFCSYTTGSLRSAFILNWNVSEYVVFLKLFLYLIVSDFMSTFLKRQGRIETLIDVMSAHVDFTHSVYEISARQPDDVQQMMLKAYFT